MAVKYSKPLGQMAQRMEGVKSRHSRAIADHVRSLARGTAAVEAVATNRSPRATDDAHRLAIADAAKRLGRSAQRADEAIQNAAREGLRDVDRRIKDTANLHPHPVFAAEVRAMFRTMTDKQRNEALRDALARRDGQTLAAIRESPQLTHGADPEHVERLVGKLEEQVAPDLTQERQEVMDALDSGLAAIRTTQRAVESGFDPAELAEIEAKEAQHKEATRELESAGLTAVSWTEG